LEIVNKVFIKLKIIGRILNTVGYKIIIENVTYLKSTRN
jgi:hypothetical protein